MFTQPSDTMYSFVWTTKLQGCKLSSITKHLDVFVQNTSIPLCMILFFCLLLFTFLFFNICLYQLLHVCVLH